MKYRPSVSLEFASPVGYSRDFDISISPMLPVHAQQTTTHFARISPSANVSRFRKRTPVALLSLETTTSRTTEFGKTLSLRVFSAGPIWTSAELYFAATSHPAMQLPQ